MFSIDESITIDSFGFMHPKFDKVVWFGNGFLFRLEKTLEDVGQMSDVEFIMEVLGGLSEVSDNF
jgi:hypothetical protein